MAEPEDIRIENAEDREWERLKDAVEQGCEDLEKVPREPHMTRDEPQFRFADE